MERKLASIQVIESIEDIIGADRIQQARVLGWSLVVRKGEFKPKDLCVFFEVDSILPKTEWSSFLDPHYRIKTKRLRGVLSQGLALPISILPEGFPIEVGRDITKDLGVDKYIPSVGGFKRGAMLGSFPSFISKTKETRLQSVPEVLKELIQHPFYWAVKCDGTSSTFYKLDGEFYACSRAVKKKRGPNVYWEMAEKYDLEENLPEGFAIQGEIVGPSIQKNRMRLEERDLYIFNVFNIKEGQYLSWPKMEAFCWDYGLQTVPFIEKMPANPERFDNSLEAWLKRAEGKYNNTSVDREGIVVRTISPVYSEVLKKRLSFKVLNNDFLLKEK